jgi:hypothetical protein
MGRHFLTKAVRRGPSMSRRPTLIALAKPRKPTPALARRGGVALIPLERSMSLGM